MKNYAEIFANQIGSSTTPVMCFYSCVDSLGAYSILRIVWDGEKFPDTTFLDGTEYAGMNGFMPEFKSN